MRSSQNRTRTRVQGRCVPEPGRRIRRSYCRRSRRTARPSLAGTARHLSMHTAELELAPMRGSTLPQTPTRPVRTRYASSCSSLDRLEIFEILRLRSHRLIDERHRRCLTEIDRSFDAAILDEVVLLEIG